MQKYDLKESQITPNNEGLQFRVQDLVYIQQGMIEAMRMNVVTHVPQSDWNNLIIMGGVDFTYSSVVGGLRTDWTAGSVFFMGEFYRVEAGTITIAGAKPRFKIIKSTYARPNIQNANNQTFEVNVNFSMTLMSTGSDLLNVCDQVRRYSWYVRNSLYAPHQNIMLNLTNAQFNTYFNQSFEPNPLKGKIYGPYENWQLNTNMSGSVPVGVDGTQAEFLLLNQKGGSKIHLLTAVQSGLQFHNHQATTDTQGAHSHAIDNTSHSHETTVNRSTSGGGDVNNPIRSIGGGSEPLQLTTTTNTHSHTMQSAGNHSHNITVLPTGGWNAIEAHNNLQPYVTVAWIFKYQ